VQSQIFKILKKVLGARELTITQRKSLK